MKRPLVAIAFLFLGACGSGASIGSPCTVNGDCNSGQYCNTAVAGGYCTRGCTFEGTQIKECPQGSVCTSFGTNALVCTAICNGAGDCRDGFECNGTSGSSTKSCKPKS
jgi:hypothetical protein